MVGVAVVMGVIFGWRFVQYTAEEWRHIPTWMYVFASFVFYWGALKFAPLGILGIVDHSYLGYASVLVIFEFAATTSTFILCICFFSILNLLVKKYYEKVASKADRG